MLSILLVFFASILSTSFALPINIALSGEEKQINVFNSITLYFISIIISVLILLCCLSSLIFVSTKFIKNK